MNTRIDINDPRLIDYVLGELDDRETAELAGALQLPENAAALRETEAIKEAVLASEEAFKGESTSDPARLTASRRQAVLDQAQWQDGVGRKRPGWFDGRVLAAAAMIVLGLGGAYLYYGTTVIPKESGRTGMDRSGRETIAARPPAEQEAAGDERMHRRPLIAMPQLLDAREAAPSEPGPMPRSMEAPGRAASGAPPAASAPPSAVEDVHIRSQVGSAEKRRQETDAFDSWDASGGMMTMSVGVMDGHDGRAVSVRESRPILPQPDRRPYPGGEQYAVIDERPFARVDEQPLSTFSLHADTAAYANIRRHLQQGRRPPKDAVRIEEMINYFSYDYPQPAGEHPFSVNIEVASCPWTPGHFLAKVGLQGRDIPREERPPANLVFLIDTSGSMSRPNRLPLVQESLKALLEMLGPEDRVGIVTYAGASLTALKSVPVSERSRIKAAIDSLKASGSTHGSAGIQDAYAMAQKHFIDGGINRIILATDGDFNVGVTNREGLLALIEEKRKTGVFLTVLGYGMGNLKDDTLELLATRGNGNYAYIDTYSEARRVLVEQLTGTLMTIAKDARIQVEFNPARVRSYRLLGFENRQMAHRDFHDDTKDAGEIGAGHTVTAIYQVVPHGAPMEPGVDELRYQQPETAPEPVVVDDTELMFVKLRYKRPDSEVSNLLEIPVPARALALDESSDDFRFAAAVAGFGLLLRDSEHKGEATHDMVRKLAASALAGDHQRAELLDLVVTAKTLQ